MLEDALKYPFRGEDSTRRLLVGGALPFLSAAVYLVGALLTVIIVGIFLMPLAIIPRILLWGYVVGVVAAVLAGRDEPPGFDDWKQIGLDGVKAFLVALAYSLPLIILLFVVIVVSAVVGSFVTELGSQTSSTSAAMVNEAAVGASAGGAFMAVVWVLMLLGIGLAILLLYYLLPAAVVNFVRHDDLAAAFHLRTVADIAFAWDYFVGWFLAAIVLLVGGAIAVPLYLVLVGFVLRFYTLVVAAHLVTQGSMRSMGWKAPLGDRPLGDAAGAETPTTSTEALRPAVRRIDDTDE